MGTYLIFEHSGSAGIELKLNSHQENVILNAHGSLGDEMLVGSTWMFLKRWDLAETRDGHRFLTPEGETLARKIYAAKLAHAQQVY